jgi:hypothetical protein
MIMFIYSLLVGTVQVGSCDLLMFGGTYRPQPLGAPVVVGGDGQVQQCDWLILCVNRQAVTVM